MTANNTGSSAGKTKRYIVTDGVSYYVAGLAVFVRDRGLAIEMPEPRADAILKAWRFYMGTSLRKEVVR